MAPKLIISKLAGKPNALWEGSEPARISVYDDGLVTIDHEHYYVELKLEELLAALAEIKEELENVE